ncbi:hypothetical protein PG984_006958 [Apiospora sp. TS-2023a]
MRDLKCYLCEDTSFTGTKSLINHVQTCTGTAATPLVCPKCNFRPNSKRAFTIHLNKCTPKPPEERRQFVCYLCGDRSFTNPNSLTDHVQTCTGTDATPLVCPKCNFRPNGKRGLKAHLRKCTPKTDNGNSGKSAFLLQCPGCEEVFTGQKSFHAHQEDTTLPCCPEYIAPAVFQPANDVLPSIIATIQRNPFLNKSVNLNNDGSVDLNNDGALVVKGTGSLVPAGLCHILNKVLCRTYMCAEESTGVTDLRAYLGEGAAQLLLALTLDVELVEQCRNADQPDGFRSVQKVTPTKCELDPRDDTRDWTLSLSLVLRPEDSEYFRICVDMSQSSLAQHAWRHEVQRKSFPEDSLWYNVWNEPSRHAQFFRLGGVAQAWFTSSHACLAWANVVKEILCVYLQTYQWFDIEDYDLATDEKPSHGLNMAASSFEKLMHIDNTDASILNASQDPEKQAYGFMLYQSKLAGRYQTSESFVALVRRRLIRSANPHLDDATLVRTRCAECGNLRTDYGPYYEVHTGFYVMRDMPCRYCERSKKKWNDSNVPQTKSSDVVGFDRQTVTEDELIFRIERKYAR